jgi:hypothetical protein
MEMETWRHGHRDMDMETWTWRGTLRHGLGNKEMETWRQKSNGKQSPGDFPYSVYRLLIVQTEV